MSYPPPQPGYGAPGGFPPPGGGGFGGPVQQSNGLAVTALVLGIVSLACIYPLGIVAVIVGFLALRKAKDLGGAGRGQAIGGIVTGAIAFVVAIILLLVFVVFANEVDNNLDDINSDPSDGVCNEDRFIQDPDC